MQLMLTLFAALLLVSACAVDALGWLIQPYVRGGWRVVWRIGRFTSFTLALCAALILVLILVYTLTQP